jgi:hypothetical protein
MAMIKFGDYYINPKHVSCIGIKEECLCGRVSGEKYWYEVFVVCYNQKIAMSCRTRSEAEEVVQRIVTYSNQLDGEEDGKTH